MKKLVAKAVVTCGIVALVRAAGAIGGDYSTTFPLTENPISEGGVWTNGLAVGLDWTNVRTTPGLVFGTQTGAGGYNDSLAVLQGTWSPDQSASATVHTVNQQSGNVFEEVELLLRFKITPHTARGYEMNYSCRQDGRQYVQIVRWNGALGDWTLLDARSGPGLKNGDQVKATIVGSTITTYINNVAIFSVTDTTFTDGNPGLGFFLQGASGLNADYGFTSYTASGLLSPTRPDFTGDFTGDLKSDVLWRHATRGEVWLWPMNGTWRTTEAPVGTVPDTRWQIRGLGTQHGDGKADILWRNEITGQVYLWPMDGAARLAETYIATVDPAYDIVGTGDYDGDGKSDILWRHQTNGEVWIWLMDGATPLRWRYVDTVDPGYVAKGAGDLNGDAKADIVWHHATRGEVWVWLMSGTTRLSQTWVATMPDVGYQIAGVADHTGDGKADILWHHATRGEVWIWTMNGTTRTAQTRVATMSDTGYQIAGSGDYNGDAKADILLHHATRGEVWVWLMNGATRLSETWVATVPDVDYRIVK